MNEFENKTKIEKKGLTTLLCGMEKDIGKLFRLDQETWELANLNKTNIIKVNESVTACTKKVNSLGKCLNGVRKGVVLSILGGGLLMMGGWAIFDDYRDRMKVKEEALRDEIRELQEHVYELEYRMDQTECEGAKKNETDG